MNIKSIFDKIWIYVCFTFLSIFWILLVSIGAISLAILIVKGLLLLASFGKIMLFNQHDVIHIIIAFVGLKLGFLFENETEIYKEKYMRR